MLLFIDEPRNVKLVRQIPETGSREPLGKIKKQQLVVSDDVAAQLSVEEAAEVEAAFDLIAQGETARVKAMVASFPGTIREVLAYYKEGATPVEQRWILGALLEGLRVVRRHEREAGL